MATVRTPQLSSHATSLRSDGVSVANDRTLSWSRPGGTATKWWREPRSMPAASGCTSAGADVRFLDAREPLVLVLAFPRREWGRFLRAGLGWAAVFMFGGVAFSEAR